MSKGSSRSRDGVRLFAGVPVHMGEMSRRVKRMPAGLHDRASKAEAGQELACQGGFGLIGPLPFPEPFALAQPGRLNTRNLLTVTSILILVGVEVFAVALAGGWAVAGLFELGEIVGYVLMAIFSVIGAYTMFRLYQLTTKVEPIVER